MIEMVRVRFAQMEWESSAPGCRTKTILRDEHQMRLVEFFPEFRENGWCCKGHQGIVLEGEPHLEISGEVCVFKAGDGIDIPPGANSRHRHVPDSPYCRLFLMEKP